MCGIVGLFDTAASTNGPELERLASSMADTLRHRGPDDAGTWTAPECGIAFGHRRLSVVDLSDAGHQPMRSATGRYVITFNGEIYNYPDLRRDLIRRGHAFRGDSDTEVMLAAIEEWGVHGAVPRFNGMFAFGLWDRDDRLLHLVRDRFGEKPIYYGWAGAIFVFGSELKSLVAFPGLDRRLDHEAIALYLRHTHFPAPLTVFRSVRKAMPGSITTVAATAAAMEPESVSYWSLREAARRASRTLLWLDQEAIDTLDHLLRDSVRMRMVADVPLGAFLSGGVDSSTIVAMMQDQSAVPVRTFTIGFLEENYNEAVHAKEVASHLGTDHTELYVSPTEALDIIPALPGMYDEPFADSSQIPTHLVSALARRSVTVALSGDAGDELFGGYTHYHRGSRLWSSLRHVPPGLRSASGAALQAVPDAAVRIGQRVAAAVWPNGPLGRADIRLRVERLAAMLQSSNPEGMYRVFVSSSVEPITFLIEGREPKTILTDPNRWITAPTVLERMMFLDTMTYLPDAILVKLDRASMAVSLETRVPLLDHRIAEFAWRLPPRMKVNGEVSKWVLRRVLDRYVPRSLVDREKMGFGVPVGEWIRGPLLEWAEGLLDERRMLEQYIFDVPRVRARWIEHRSGSRDWSSFLWSVLMFQAWLEGVGSASPAPSPTPLVASRR